MLWRTARSGQMPRRLILSPDALYQQQAVLGPHARREGFPALYTHCTLRPWALGPQGPPKLQSPLLPCAQHGALSLTTSNPPFPF